MGCTDNRYIGSICAEPAANVDDGSSVGAWCDYGNNDSYTHDGSALTYQGIEYKLVTIGEQCWFKENLEVTSYRNGDAILALLEGRGKKNVNFQRREPLLVAFA